MNDALSASIVIACTLALLHSCTLALSACAEHDPNTLEGDNAARWCMDNLAHTLVGAAIGMAGLKRKTGLGLATLMIAANLPDLDALGLLLGENLAWRRGWTHGPIALVFLPLLLACAIVGFDRFQTRRGTRPDTRLPVRFGWVLALSYIGILSHPLLDFFNTYGIRCLMPFSDQWFYGDALFIIDPWFWSILGITVWMSRNREKQGNGKVGQPALIGLTLASIYSLAMGVGGRVAEHHVADQINASGLGQPKRVLASPVPIDPLRRRIIFETDAGYGFGEYRWLSSPKAKIQAGLVPTNMHDPAIAIARKQEKEVSDFLYWSRFPFATIQRDANGTEVIIGDARYNRSPVDGRFNVRAKILDSGRAHEQSTINPQPAPPPE